MRSFLGKKKKIYYHYCNARNVSFSYLDMQTDKQIYESIQPIDDVTEACHFHYNHF